MKARHKACKTTSILHFSMMKIPSHTAIPSVILASQMAIHHLELTGLNSFFWDTKTKLHESCLRNTDASKPGSEYRFPWSRRLWGAPDKKDHNTLEYQIIFGILMPLAKMTSVPSIIRSTLRNLFKHWCMSIRLSWWYSCLFLGKSSELSTGNVWLAAYGVIWLVTLSWHSEITWHNSLLKKASLGLWLIL